MRVYLIRRLLLTIPTLFIASVIIFLSIRFIPGDVVDVMMMRSQSGISEETRAAIRRELGLDTPLPIQYGRWLGILPLAASDESLGKARFNGVLQGNIGTSLWTGVPVFEALKLRLLVTFELSFLGLVLGLMIAMPIGIYSALRQDTLGDYIARSIAMAFIAVPYFWIGILVVVFGSLWFRYMPPLRLIPFVEDPLGNLGQFIVPAMTLGMVLSGWTMRLTRTMMLEVLRQDYVRTAWAKGLKERVVVVRHALKNSLIPVVSLIGLQLPLLFGGTVVVEQIFLLPGVGRYTIEATISRDYPVISGVLLLFGGTVVLANLLIDLSYGFLDPRIRFEYPDGSRERRRGLLVDSAVRLVREKPLGTIGAAITLVFLLMAVFADVLAPYGMNQGTRTNLAPPSAEFWLGTDELGRDIFSRVVIGARISMGMGLAASAVSIVISVAIGLLSGYIGGKFDIIVQRFVDAWMSLPGLIWMMLVLSTVGRGVVQLVIVLSLVLGVGGSRIIRGAVISAKENVYVAAALAIGSRTDRVLIRHILPNIMAPIVMLFSVRVPDAILIEASLSFLGFGMPPPYPSWGSMLSGTSRKYMFVAPWMALWPGVALALVVYGVNIFGDALRDILDPRMRGGGGRFGVGVKKSGSSNGRSE